MKSKLEEHHDENDFEEENIVIKDFDDVFDFIGGWGPFQVKIIYKKSHEFIDDFFPVPCTVHWRCPKNVW